MQVNSLIGPRTIKYPKQISESDMNEAQPSTEDKLSKIYSHMHRSSITEREEMGSPLHFSTFKSPTHVTKIPPRKTLAKPIPLSKRPSYALQVQGRGFGLTTISNDKQKRTEGNSSSSNNNNRGEDDEDAIPEVVFHRMLVRISLFVGVPMASGVGMLYVLSMLKERGVWVSPGWLPFLTLLLSFGTSALGIAYGTLSTSWDIEKEGSLVGWEEALKNWPELWKEEENGKR